MRSTIGLVLGALLATLLACGAGAPKAVTTAPPPQAVPDSGAGGGALPDLKAEIAQAEQQILADLQALQLSPPPALAPGTAVTAMSATPTPPTTDPACVRSERDTCKTSCQLADSICNNASKICKIANDSLGGTDGWANGKCTSGNASCESARTKCCGCT
jgi:hypothetical protein